jgi:hypothetical protein
MMVVFLFIRWLQFRTSPAASSSKSAGQSGGDETVRRAGVRCFPGSTRSQLPGNLSGNRGVVCQAQNDEVKSLFLSVILEMCFSLKKTDQFTVYGVHIAGCTYWVCCTDSCLSLFCEVCLKLAVPS